MNVPVWVAELASAFWAEAGMAEPFPRALRRPTARGLPVAVVLLPRLRLDGVRAWLRDHDVPCPCIGADRPLRACLAAASGWGIIFLDGADLEDEQRFSLAHELAHFLRHYWQPRRLACRHLGEAILEVLDGRRPPTPAERAHALLRDVPLGLHLHLMQRGPRRGVVSADVAAAEEEADRLAYELLVPARAVLAQTGAAAGAAGRARVAEVLRAAFGLPPAQADDYSRLLVPVAWEDTLLRRLHP